MINKIKNIYAEAAKDLLGVVKGTSKPWLCGGTRKEVEEKRHFRYTKVNRSNVKNALVKKRSIG